jgi:hypothetical protein
MSIQTDLKQKIEELNKTIYNFKKITIPPVVDPLYNMVDEPDFFMTDRQAAKKMMMESGDEPGVGNERVSKVDEETAHLAVYGKLLYDNNKLVDDEIKYPECVDLDYAMKTDSPLIEKIKNMKIESKNAIKGLCVKKTELTEDTTKAGLEISLAIPASIDAITCFPKPQPSLALSTVLSVLSSVSKLQSKVLELIPYLPPLLFLINLLPVSKATKVISLVLILISALVVIISTIEAVTVKPLKPVSALIPSSQSEIDNTINTSLSGTLNGTVSDLLTGIPIAGALVKANSIETTTDENGFYTLPNMPKGGINLIIEAFGYGTKTGTPIIQSGKTTTTNVALTKGNF